MKKIEDIPKKAQAVILKNYSEQKPDITTEEVDVPLPKHGEVLVRMISSPINPSDLMFTKGLYGFKKELPVIPGFEGCGIVVAAGGDLTSKFLLGKRVACGATESGSGTWANYMLTSSSYCMPIKKFVKDEEAAMMIVNPMTAWGLVDQAVIGNHKAIVQTAAASALGKMIIRLGKRRSIPTINIVRRDEQVQLLQQQEKAQYVINSNDEDFCEKLQDLCHKLKATIAFDAVTGELSAQVAAAMPIKSELLVYGSLSQEPVNISSRDLIFQQKIVRGFWLSQWLKEKNLLSKIRNVGKVQKLLSNDLNTHIQEQIPLSDVAKGLELYENNMTAGKVLLKCSMQ
ncbi:zinc-binding dehydrogenase [Candidatus Uabimicrobium sp. HlEnr_7]|uniref:zinc-binding dehydrogenase n=1 Tax=Candidatus Uabimicrobium helgolandensis TaxID=3095367 RepID=UPI0035569E77